MESSNKFWDKSLVKIGVLILFWLVWFAIYQPLNARGAQVGVHWISPNIYIPAMVYPYVFGMAILAWIPWFWNWKTDRFYKLLLLYTYTSVLMFSIYYFYPVYMLRRSYEGLLLADALMRWIVGMDDPANCFPSNHCAVSTLGFIGIAISTAPKWVKWLTGALAGIVCLSTVLVGQHYWIDIPAGIILSVLTYFIVYKVILKKIKKRSDLKKEI